MANYFIVTGGVGSNKGVMGRQISLSFGIPLLFAENYYTQAQLDFVIAGRPFDYRQGFDWSESIGEALKATGGGVMVCAAVRHEDWTFMAQNDTTTIIYADASLDAVTERWNREKNIAGNIADQPGSIHFNGLENLAENIENLKALAIANANAKAEFDRQYQILWEKERELVHQEYLDRQNRQK